MARLNSGHNVEGCAGPEVVNVTVREVTQYGVGSGIRTVTQRIPEWQCGKVISAAVDLNIMPELPPDDYDLLSKHEWNAAELAGPNKPPEIG